ncbi:hypothetical protein SSS_04045 [Sarcoptes scabiei]|nr:hypothetical protein SSS_04045 [Sarcoptes scabiei]
MQWSEVIVNETNQTIRNVDQQSFSSFRMNRQDLIDKNNDEIISNFDINIEECDLTDFYSSLRLTIFDVSSGSIIKEISLGQNQWICSIPNRITQRLNNLSLLALRNDVDAFIYRIEIGPDDCHLKHIGVIDAFGYVQASKIHKHFVTILRDRSKNDSFNLSVIADGDLNLLLYWKKNLSDRRFGNHHIIHLNEHQLKHKHSSLTEGKNRIETIRGLANASFRLT